ncbi:hypothetical protein [Streptomyces javensis]|uniref:hypothetical protein n=1 Tax=Streptomyces javensis TaxID=114698 RepID=UPI0031D4AD33
MSEAQYASAESPALEARKVSVRPVFSSPSPDHPPAPDPSLDALRLQHGESLRGTTRRARRALVAANAVPLVVGIALSLLTAVPAVHVYGHITLGLVWGILQCGLFVATVWVYETRCTACDPVERPRTSDVPQAGAPGAPPVDDPWR